eukprot:9485726-Pyramimonas_sp.AAC.1
MASGFPERSSQSHEARTAQGNLGASKGAGVIGWAGVRPCGGRPGHQGAEGPRTQNKRQQNAPPPWRRDRWVPQRGRGTGHLDKG